MAWKEIVNKIPDLQFDFYARFIPGSVALIAYFLITKATIEISTLHLILAAFVAYVAGHFIQPPTGFIVKAVEKLCRSDPDNKYNAAKLNPDCAALVGKVTKAHAEANSMLATGLLMAIVYFLLKFHSIPGWGLVVALVVFTVERVFARKRKISDLPAP